MTAYERKQGGVFKRLIFFLAEKTGEKLSALLRNSLDSDAKILVMLKQEPEITEK